MPKRQWGLYEFKKGYTTAVESLKKSIVVRKSLRMEAVRLRKSNDDLRSQNKRLMKRNYNLKKNLEFMRRERKVYKTTTVHVSKYQDLKWLYDQAQDDLQKYRDRYKQYEHIFKR